MADVPRNPCQFLAFDVNTKRTWSIPARESESNLVGVSNRPLIEGSDWIPPRTASRSLGSSGNRRELCGCGRRVLAQIPPFLQCRLGGRMGEWNCQMDRLGYLSSAQALGNGCDISCLSRCSPTINTNLSKFRSIRCSHRPCPS